LRSESDRNYGGEEGAKPFGRVSYDGAISHVSSNSEGKAEEDDKRPQWYSDNDSQPEIIIFLPPGISGQSSSSLNLQLPKLSSSEERENYVNIPAPCKEELEGHSDIAPSQDFLKRGLEGPIIFRKSVAVV